MTLSTLAQTITGAKTTEELAAKAALQVVRTDIETLENRFDDKLKGLNDYLNQMRSQINYWQSNPEGIDRARIEAGHKHIKMLQQFIDATVDLIDQQAQEICNRGQQIALEQNKTDYYLRRFLVEKQKYTPTTNHQRNYYWHGEPARRAHVESVRKQFE
jgi:hypothetical protein